MHNNDIPSIPFIPSMHRIVSSGCYQEEKSKPKARWWIETGLRSRGQGAE
jgi:hypothetical protein